MSLSWMRANPSTDEPSNQRPWSIASSSLWSGIETVFTSPMMSVNWRLTKRTPSAAAFSRTRRFWSADRRR